MAKERVTIEHTSAKARHRYWQTIYEATVEAGDAAAAAAALLYVVEYGTLIALIVKASSKG